MEIRWKERLSGSLEPRVKALSARATSTIRVSPAKWAGIAAGAGAGVGLIGRFLLNRGRHSRVPSIVIIEAAC